MKPCMLIIVNCGRNQLTRRIFVAMPIKDPVKRREYQKELMRKKRNGLTENVSPKLDPNSNVSPFVSPNSEMLDPGLTVRPTEKKLDQVVRPDNLVIPQLLDPVSPCSHCPELEQEKQALIEKYSRLENNSKNHSNSLSMPNLSALISKHQKFQTIQRIYNQQEVKEREFLKNLLNQL